MCKVLKVSSSSYYHWLKSPISKREKQQQELADKVRNLYDKNKGRYGSPRITAELAATGIDVSRPLV